MIQIAIVEDEEIYVKQLTFTNSSQNNQHSTLDSANKKCYNIARTKEEEEKKSSQTVPVPKMLVNKHNEMKLEKER